MAEPQSGPVRAVTFDLDGTLADTLPDIVAALIHGLAGHALPLLDPVACRPLIGEGVIRFIERALPEGREALVPNVAGRLLPQTPA